MDIKNVQDAMKLQRELSRKLTQQLEALTEGKDLTLDALLQEKEKDIELLRIDVEEATKERDLVVSRWEQRIEQRNATLIKLEAEVVELKKQVT